MIVDLFESESIVTTHRACHTMATAPFGRVRSVASRDLLGLPDAQAWPDSRRYRKKIRTILEAARWPLLEKRPLLYRDWVVTTGREIRS
jgi:hypothetical protein